MGIITLDGTYLGSKMSPQGGLIVLAFFGEEQFLLQLQVYSPTSTGCPLLLLKALLINDIIEKCSLQVCISQSSVALQGEKLKG